MPAAQLEHQQFRWTPVGRALVRREPAGEASLSFTWRQGRAGLCNKWVQKRWEEAWFLHHMGTSDDCSFTAQGLVQVPVPVVGVDGHPTSGACPERPSAGRRKTQVAGLITKAARAYQEIRLAAPR